MKLSVIVVSYNVKGYLSLCVSSALKAMERLGSGQSELFVVDNASTDGSVDWVSLSHPSVKLIALEENRGFSAANNVALAQARGEWVLLLNPDTIVPEDTFDKVLSHVEADPAIGGLGVPMFDGAGVWLPESKRGVPTPWASFCRLSGAWRLAPRSPRFNGYYLGHVAQDETANVEVLSGAFMWMRRAALEKVGFLDESFFMYGEDIDLSLRILKGGWVNRYYSEAPIVHFKGESTKKGSLSYVRVFHEAMRIFSEKHFAGRQALAMRWMIRLGIRLRSVSAFFQGLVQRHSSMVLDVVVAALGTWGILSVHGASTEMTHPLIPQVSLVTIAAIATWCSGRWFGSADRPFQRLRGLMAGAGASVALILLYSLLPETLRVSRLSALLSAIGLGCLPLLTRWLLVFSWPAVHRWKPARPRVGVVASEERKAALMEWVGSSYGSALNLSFGAGTGAEAMTELADCDMVLHGVDCGGAACLSAVRKGRELGLDVRIVPADLLLALGGDRRVGAAAARLSWGADGLGRLGRLRVKRRMDIFWSVFILTVGPGRGRQAAAFSRKNAWQVLRGRLTWLGFHQGWEGADRLPDVPPGVLYTGAASRAESLQDARRLDLRYASDFGWMRDLELLMNLRMD